MKKLILLTALLSAPTMADEYCDKIGSLAKKMMEVRQQGVSMSDVINKIKQSGTISKVSQQMAIDAYELPRFRTKKNQETSIEDFENEWYLLCLKSRS